MVVTLRRTCAALWKPVRALIERRPWVRKLVVYSLVGFFAVSPALWESALSDAVFIAVVMLAFIGFVVLAVVRVKEWWDRSGKSAYQAGTPLGPDEVDIDAGGGDS